MLLLGVSIVDDIDYGLLDDEVQIKDHVRSEGKGFAYLFDEGGQAADFCNIVC
jgi:hypothetical protein